MKDYYGINNPSGIDYDTWLHEGSDDYFNGDDEQAEELEEEEEAEEDEE